MFAMHLVHGMRAKDFAENEVTANPNPNPNPNDNPNP